MADEESANLGSGVAASAILSTATREKADAFIDKQNALADLQIEDLKRENAIRHWSLRVRHISDVLKLGFELALAFIVIAIAIGLGVAIWAATQADGLVIDTFNVPPAMSNQGLTGQVVAAKLLDRLTALQNETVSSRAASSFANDWTNDIKVEIPDTGVSLGEVVRYLHSALGHEMHLSGEMYQTHNGAALTVRIDNDAGQTFTASSGDLDELMQRAAFAVYARAQPYRYSVYLFQHNKVAEAYAVAKALALSGSPTERAWAYIGMGNVLNAMGRFEEQGRYIRLAQTTDPKILLSHFLMGNVATALGHEEAAIEASRDTLNFIQSGNKGETTANWLKLGTEISQQVIAENTGDYLAAAQATADENWFQQVNSTTERATDTALAHDPAKAVALVAPFSQSQLATSGADSGSDNAAYARTLAAMESGDWKAAIDVMLRDRAAAHDFAVQTHGMFSDRNSRDQLTGPMLSILYAHIGDWAKADAMLKTLPNDCDICGRAHGKVEALRHNWNEAARWFALVSARSPDVPLADSDWGAMLLKKGDLDGAIAKFDRANRKGPHYADPLEMWGEALTRKNRSDLALAKFAEANKYAPNWGRLHLKWGEALLWSGDKAGAQKQFATAAALNMTSSEKSELARGGEPHVRGS